MYWSLLLLILMGQCASLACSRHVYHLVQEKKTWPEAQSYCRDKYTDLATIDNMEDMRRLIATNQSYTGDAWIGLERSPSFQWLWSQPEIDYIENNTNWLPPEPNDHGGSENCVWMNNKGKWIDISCNKKTFFICYNGSNQVCLIKKCHNWTEAQQYCREHHVDLASGKDQTDNDEIRSLIGQRHERFRAAIGLFRDYWKWSDNSSTSFRNWHLHMTDNRDGPKCSVTLLSQGGKWDNAKCEEHKPFFCHNDKLILIHSNKTWKEALTYCRENHNDLVSIHDTAIQDWVQQTVKTADTPYVWLGMHYTCTLDFWFWVSDKPSCYQNWALGNGTGECGMAAAMEKERPHRWVNRKDDEKFNFICTKAPI